MTSTDDMRDALVPAGSTSARLWDRGERARSRHGHAVSGERSLRARRVDHRARPRVPPGRIGETSRSSAGVTRQWARFREVDAFYRIAQLESK
jgi:hypothetical protein